MGLLWLGIHAVALTEALPRIGEQELFYQWAKEKTEIYRGSGIPQRHYGLSRPCPGEDVMVMGSPRASGMRLGLFAGLLEIFGGRCQSIPTLQVNRDSDPKTSGRLSWDSNTARAHVHEQRQGQGGLPLDPALGPHMKSSDADGFPITVLTKFQSLKTPP